MRLLVRTPNWLGDAVMALPALAALRAHYPGAVLAAAGPAPLAPLLAAAPGVDEVVGVVRGGRGARRREAEALRRGAFDAAVLLPNSFGSAWTVRRAGIPERWGFAGRWRRALLTRAVTPPRRGLGPVHQADRYLALVRGLGVEPVGAEPRLEAPAALRARARTLLAAAGDDEGRPWVGMAPGAAYGHAKRWPPTRYAGVAARLMREGGARVVLLGSVHDRDAGRAIESTLAAGTRRDPGVLNLIGRTDLPALIGLLAECRTLIAGDSGAMHLAAALGVPVTAIFGPTDERLTAPIGGHAVLTHPVWCRPCFFRDCPIDHRCMTRISEDRVLAAAGRWLGAGGGAAPGDGDGRPAAPNAPDPAGGGAQAAAAGGDDA